MNEGEQVARRGPNHAAKDRFRLDLPEKRAIIRVDTSAGGARLPCPQRSRKRSRWRSHVLFIDILGYSKLSIKRARVAVQAGEKDLAIQQLAISAQDPIGVNYGDLKLNPIWDPLRGDPHFQRKSSPRSRRSRQISNSHRAARSGGFIGSVFTFQFRFSLNFRGPGLWAI